MNTKKVILIILDGWGHGLKTKANAILAARTPCMDSLYMDYPNAELLTSGEHVGLPDGQMGNSEVGHLNIGAGRIVYQDLVKINKAIREKTIDTNPMLLETFSYLKQEKGRRALHLIGLVSDGGIHSHSEHLYKLCTLAKENGIEHVFIHAFTDGRDCDPKSGLSHIENLEKQVNKSVGKIASICGRYYAMDRDKRWERIKLAYDLLTAGKGNKFTHPADAIRSSYEENVTDEFIKPCVITDDSGNPLGLIKNGDAVICFNFRTDRCREITGVLTQTDMPEAGMKTIPLHYVTMTNYDESFKNIPVIFHKDNLKNTLGEIISESGKSQVRIAETEKYPHVTFFFSGGREQVFEGEKRIMIPSPKVATYDLKPSMSAVKVKDAIVEEIKNNSPDFICLNFANSDMVGHTGVYSAVVEAVECVDLCLSEVIKAALEKEYAILVIADHGNAEFMINDDGSPNTAHTNNPVPVILAGTNYKKIGSGKLCDLAPTILEIMGLPVPEEMDGTKLVG